ncbi:ABC transporter permease [Nocardioides carbamazepini]|jgi:peptide/nickel transport system permease protein|uniref:ABC transporter permease n=1 Tax=Nocardioides carbamazepini TaxID=2854259 RepID=UPI00214A7269|nr:ABC transporter permease [Nocardioides carbamazepini]MCR1784072.1 ABC transporter permease [Nocardioides carbamazepini]
MALYICKRVAQLVPLLLVIAFVVFVALSLAPGDPTTLLLGQNATPDEVARLNHELGLDRSVVVQYLSFVGDALRGDLGESYRSGRDVVSELGRTASVSATLAVTAMVLAVTIGVGVGILTAVKQYSWIDNVVRVGVLALVSMPVFWLAILLIIAFSVKLSIFPAFGWGTYGHLVLPAAALCTYPLAVITRLTRSSMLEVLGSDYVRTARAAGMPERTVVLKYALKNALGPVLTVVGLQFGALIGGAVLTETIFGIPGMGRLMVTAIEGRDYPIVRGAVLLGTVVFVVLNLAVDVLYKWVDPRQRGL